MRSEWRNAFRSQFCQLVYAVLVLHLAVRNCCCLNFEGLALLAFRGRVKADPYSSLSNWNPYDEDPCKWYGVHCIDGKVISLELAELSLQGILAPELGQLIHLQKLTLCENKFSGTIPKELGELENLELLNLRHNDLIGQIPSDLGNISTLKSLLLSNNQLDGSIPPELGNLVSLCELQLDRNQLSGVIPGFDHGNRKLGKSISLCDLKYLKKADFSFNYIGGEVPACLYHLPWSCFKWNCLQDQTPQQHLQRECGVPKLNRVELEAACEEFSNIIGSSPDSMVFKGTLSSGVEIAVTSSTISSANDWSARSEYYFRQKIEILSRMNHKNLVNLLGYCEEEEPFTRMMVFEYAPNGTLFEHLHNKEAEHLDWATRMRIIMGIAYCLQYMHHELELPITYPSLHSNAVYLTDDYAAKLAGLGLWKEAVVKSEKMQSFSNNGNLISYDDIELSGRHSLEVENNVYGFGVLMLEIISGKLPYMQEQGLLINWAMEYLGNNHKLSYIVDPSLKNFKYNELEIICEVVQCCIHPDQQQRPSMRDITSKLREVLSISPDAACPKLSPLWWAELEILSQDGS